MENGVEVKVLICLADHTWFTVAYRMNGYKAGSDEHNRWIMIRAQSEARLKHPAAKYIIALHLEP